MTRSSLPFGSEFSPSTVELPWLLEAARQSNGDWQALEGAIYEQYFKSDHRDERNSRKLANNAKLGMAAYYLIRSTKDSYLTGFGEELYALKEDEEKLYRHLAKHILLNLNGLTMIETIKDIQNSGVTPNLISIRGG